MSAVLRILFCALAFVSGHLSTIEYMTSSRVPVSYRAFVTGGIKALLVLRRAYQLSIVPHCLPT